MPAMTRLAVTRLGMFARRWRPDHNPLRRYSDRAESAVLAMLFVVFFAAAPFVGQACGASAHAIAERVQRGQQTRSQVPAVLLKPEPGQPVSTGFGMYFPEAPARWTAPDGEVVTGDMPVRPGAAAGTTVRVWVTREGRLTAPPLKDSQVSGDAAIAAVLGVVALAGALALAGTLVRRALDKRRMAFWEAAWLATGTESP
jgi:cytochrome b561